MFNWLKTSNKPDIFQFSPIRSGSTLVFNMLREVFPKKKIIKDHRIRLNLLDKLQVVVTYRNPIDSVCSSLLRYKMPPTQKNIKQQLDELKMHGLDQLIDLFDHPTILKLKYEEFYNNFDVIFHGLESYFETQIPEESKQLLKRRYEVNNVSKVLTKQLKGFQEYDEITHLHGDHISEYNGQPGSSNNLFSLEQLEYLNQELKPYMEKMNYH